MGGPIQSFEDLDVYKLALELQQEIFEKTKRFPPEERYSLIDQIRRAYRSIAANLAEAWHKRMYPAHFVSKLSDADGEQGETRHWLRTSLLSGYITQEEHSELSAKCCRIGRMLGKMTAEPEKWVRK